MSKKKKLIIVLVFAILLCSILLIFTLKDFYKISDRTAKVSENIKKNEYPVLGWIKVQGTNIDYPVIYSKNVNINNIDVDYSFAWRNYNEDNSKNRLVLLGHNIRNISSNPLINQKEFNDFENLPSFLYYDFVKDNKYIQYSDEKNNYLYKIYSVYTLQDETVNYNELLDEESKEYYINESLKNSIYKFDVDVNKQDKLISLVTCTRFFGPMSSSIVVDARMVRKNEKIRNYEVKKNKNYKEIEKIMKGDDTNEKA